MQTITANKNDAGQRLDKFLAKYMTQAPKSFFYKMLRKKNIVLNGKKAAGNEILAVGDEIRLFLSDETIEKFRAKEQASYPVTDLSILYEDEHIALINKPAGMLSQKADDDTPSLVEYFIGYLISSGQLKEAELSVSNLRSAIVWTAIPAGSWRPERPFPDFRICRNFFENERWTNIITHL